MLGRKKGSGRQGKCHFVFLLVSIRVQSFQPASGEQLGEEMEEQKEGIDCGHSNR